MIYRPIVCLDPGHGGVDSGAISAADVNGWRHEEKNLNLEAAMALRAALLDIAISVVLTRREDRNLTIRNRCRIADDADAAALISLHHNSFSESEVEGFEIYYGPDESDLELAATIRGRVLTELANRLIRDRGNKNEGLSGRHQLPILRWSRAPAVLIEFGFLSNPHDLEQVTQRGLHAALAPLIAEGVDRFIKSL